MGAKASTQLQVNIANDLNRSAQGLNVGEKRLLMLAISKLDSKAKPTILNATSARAVITVSEMVQTYDLNPDKAYQEAKKAAEGLMKRQVRLKPNDADSSLIQWVGKSAYNKGEGWILIEFYYGLFPSLFELPKLFTSYKLNRASGLKSVYSWRLFELLMQFKSTGLLNIPIDDFNHALETPDSLRANFANLRNRVIEPAVKEIREKDGLAVNWEAVKAGRKVKALKFTFPLERGEALLKDTKRTASDAELETIDKPMTKKEAQKAASQIVGKAKDVSEVMPLDELKSRLDAAKQFAKLTGDPLGKYLTENDRKAIQHYQITI